MHFTTLKTGRISGGGNSGLPSRLKLMGWGSNPGAKGTFIVNGTTLALLPKNQAATNYDRVALDFEHNTVPSHPNYKGEPIQVAGYGTPAVIANDGLYLEKMEWTAEGRDFIGGGHYSDLSPAIGHNEAGEVTFLHSAAACRQGALHDRIIELTALSAHLGGIPPIALSPAEEQVRVQLGISLETWHHLNAKAKTAQVQAQALLPLHARQWLAEQNGKAAEEKVRLQLGISPEDWARQN